MQKRSARLAVVVAWLFPAPAAAQSLPVQVFNDFRYAVTDMVAVWIAPFHGEGRDYATAGLVVGGLGLTALADEEIGGWIRTHPKAGVLEMLKPFREDFRPRFENLGAGRSLDEISAGFYVLGIITGSADLRDAAVGCVAAEKSNGIVRNFVYKGVSRERPLFREISGTDTIFRLGHPYDIRFPSRDPWWDNSFFGGHGANIVSCTSFLTNRFDLGLAEPAMWALALGISFGRVADQRHWMSDALAGVVFGYAIGRYVADRSLDRAARRDAHTVDAPGQAHAGSRPSLLDGLYLARDGGGMIIGWKRRF